MAGEEIIGLLVFATVTLVLGALVLARRYTKVPPGQAMVVYGRQSGAPGFLVITGGAKFVVPIVEQVRFFRTDGRRIDQSVDRVRFRDEGEAWFELSAAFAVPTDRANLELAAHRILGKSDAELEAMVRSVVEARLRAAAQSASREGPMADVEAFISTIRAACQEDLGEWGLALTSLVAKEFGSGPRPRLT